MEKIIVYSIASALRYVDCVAVSYLRNAPSELGLWRLDKHFEDLIR